MIYMKNLPLWERTLRIVVGIVAVAYAVLNLSGVSEWVFIAGGVGIALSGIFGFCPACALAGRRLKPRA